MELDTELVAGRPVQGDLRRKATILSGREIGVESGKVRSIPPLFNRMVVFSTPDAAHGHPEPITAPEGRSRLCFSAYYFTSPDLPDSPQGRHGVLFSGRHDGQNLVSRARRFVPPVVVEGAKSLRRGYRRARA